MLHAQLPAGHRRQVIAAVKGRAQSFSEPEEPLIWLSRAREIDPYFEEPWYWRVAALAHMSRCAGDARVRAYPYGALAAGCHARLGEAASAGVSVGECLSMHPGFSVAKFMSNQPFKRAAQAELPAFSLRLAGLPD